MHLQKIIFNYLHYSSLYGAKSCLLYFLKHWKQQQLEKNGTSAQNGKMKPKLQTWDSQTECNDDISRAATRGMLFIRHNYQLFVPQKYGIHICNISHKTL